MMRMIAFSLHRLAPLSVAGALCSSQPSTAAAQASASADVVASLRDRLDPATRSAVQLILDSAATTGLPMSPLVNKALEGVAKQASGGRIVNAVRLLAADLTVARQALGPEADEGALTAGVGALRAGVSATYLRELRTARPPTALARPLGVLTDLVSRGVPVDTAAPAVLSLARAGTTDAAFTSFEQHVLRDIGAGVPPGAAAAARASAGKGQSARPSGGRPSPPASGKPPAPASPSRPAPPHARPTPHDVGHHP